MSKRCWKLWSLLLVWLHLQLFLTHHTLLFPSEVFLLFSSIIFLTLPLLWLWLLAFFTWIRWGIFCWGSHSCILVYFELMSLLQLALFYFWTYRRWSMTFCFSLSAQFDFGSFLQLFWLRWKRKKKSVHIMINACTIHKLERASEVMDHCRSYW